jgi:hypothetical protein
MSTSVEEIEEIETSFAASASFFQTLFSIFIIDVSFLWIL